LESPEFITGGWGRGRECPSPPENAPPILPPFLPPFPYPVA